MRQKPTKIATDTSTEQQIKDAARLVFLRKGYAAARTRDIAVEAGLNMALLHYYFRSKEKLFQVVMLETLQQFAAGLIEMLNEKETSLEEKLGTLASRYIDLLIQQPDLPLFIMSEIRNNPHQLLGKVGMREAVIQSEFFRQFNAVAVKIKSNPIQLFMSFIGMIVFPFAGKPLLQAIWEMSNEDFMKLMQERKKLVPIWIKLLLNQR